ncbi:Lipid A biosynthesis lauroyltransferase [Chlamydia avium]|uniref:Bacterial lipid A biosynthesis acyltransferase family protein n=1 Tax=Chlamydia avium TaxID=1457141 RepID=A0ABN0MSG0_9CHLA|nr:lipid A biosynthesis acyltransferase [Chlamydia avium]EPP37381.1 bacterial lipid A biosynthesis acyltransferase family protein [Chlamydia psittaci 10_743_SC13]EPP38358.1 bacterial lipid A biosynthesis acyltransferase family protein [Chlamydia avium]VVT42912.1 Lipid A biosynthesis lauroyltransferase [Chlamydia avium]
MFNRLRYAKKIIVDSCVYFLGSFFIYIFKFIPLPLLHYLGKILGTIIFYIIPDYRKTALTNLTLAFPHKPFLEKHLLAKQSIQHVTITLLELLAVEGLVHKLDELISIATSDTQPEGFSSHEVITKEELEETFSELANNQGIILFCGHQANWELPFLYITRDFPGLAFAKPIKNARLNKKIFSLREIFKGKIISPKQGIHYALQALQQGHIIGIVGDQALLISSYAYPLFGHEAFTTTTPALLAYKTGKPVMAISVYRQPGGYKIIPSKKFYADKSLPIKEATSLLMDNLMNFLEKGIACKPEQWMWMHKRWKKKLHNKIKKKYAYSYILIVLPNLITDRHLQFLNDLAELYLGAQLTLAVPTQISPEQLGNVSPSYTIQQFHTPEQLILIPNVFHAVFDLFGLSKTIFQHFKTTGSLAIYTHKKLEKKLIHPQDPLIKALHNVLREP